MREKKEPYDGCECAYCANYGEDECPIHELVREHNKERDQLYELLFALNQNYNPAYPGGKVLAAKVEQMINKRDFKALLKAFEIKDA